MFNRKYIFNPGPFSIAISCYFSLLECSWWFQLLSKWESSQEKKSNKNHGKPPTSTPKKNQNKQISPKKGVTILQEEVSSSNHQCSEYLRKFRVCSQVFRCFGVLSFWRGDRGWKNIGVPLEQFVGSTTFWCGHHLAKTCGRLGLGWWLLLCVWWLLVSPYHLSSWKVTAPTYTCTVLDLHVVNTKEYRWCFITIYLCRKWYLTHPYHERKG